MGKYHIHNHKENINKGKPDLVNSHKNKALCAVNSWSKKQQKHHQCVKQSHENVWAMSIIRADFWNIEILP